MEQLNTSDKKNAPFKFFIFIQFFLCLCVQYVYAQTIMALFVWRKSNAINVYKGLQGKKHITVCKRSNKIVQIDNHPDKCNLLVISDTTVSD